MKYAILGILCAFLIFLGVQIWYFYERGEAASSALQAAEEKLRAMEARNGVLRANAEFYGEPQNLQKELRARFHYKLPDENMVVIVPDTPTATPNSTP